MRTLENLMNLAEKKQQLEQEIKEARENKEFSKILAIEETLELIKYTINLVIFGLSE